MTDHLMHRLTDAGIDVPGAAALPLAAGVPVVGFPSAGAEALTWWRRLRAVSGRTGLWPVLIPSAEEAISPAGSAAGPAARLARAAELNGAELLNPRDPGFGMLDAAVREDLLDRWPDECCRLDGFGLPFHHDGQPAQVLVAVVAAEHGWQLPALLDYGHWNACPEPAVHSAVLRYWYGQYGAELVCMTASGLELALTRPPRTRLDALAFAWEYPDYCLDGMDLYSADDIPDLAACLIDAEVVRFWWD